MSRASPVHTRHARRRRALNAPWAMLFAVACAAPAAGTAFAQTCDVPQALRSESMQSSSTCGGDFSITSVCNGEVPIDGPVSVWELQVGVGADAILQLVGPDPGFAPVAYLVDAGGPCGSGGCAGHVDLDTPLDLSGVRPGYYHLIVASSAWNPPGACGFYSLAVDGEFGDTDHVFADGFD